MIKNALKISMTETDKLIPYARNDQHWEAAAFAFTCAAAGLVIIGIVLFVSWL